MTDNQDDVSKLVGKLRYEASEDRRISGVARQKRTKEQLDQRAQVSLDAAALIETLSSRIDQAKQHCVGQRAVREEDYSDPEVKGIVRGANSSCRQILNYLDPPVITGADNGWRPNDPCASCGSTNTGWDWLEGGFCRSCGKSDSDD